MIKPDDKINPAELANIIDDLMQQGTGHGNVDISQENGSVSVSTCRSNDCSAKKGACCQPTELLDEDL